MTALDALRAAIPHTAPVALAVSGGPDSLALLLLAAEACRGRVHALTVDHGLRAAAATEAAAVGAICAARGIPHATLQWAGSKPATSLQAAARDARYALMAAWCGDHGVPVLMTGHHADDQAETLLMRLVRGAGAGGLSGIRASRPLGHGVTLVRPLLGIRRAELAAIVAAAGLSAADDPSNRDPRYDRTAARAVLAATPWLDAAALAASAAHLADAEAALDWVTARAWAGAATVAGHLVSLDVTGLPAEIIHRLIRRAIAALAPAAEVRGDAIARLAVQLQAGRTATLAGIQASGGAIWRFSRAPPRR